MGRPITDRHTGSEGDLCDSLASEEQPVANGIAELAGEGDVRGDERAAVGRALHPKPAAEDGKPVRQPNETAPVRPGASDAVVAHLDTEGAVLDARRDRGALGRKRVSRRW